MRISEIAIILIGLGSGVLGGAGGFGWVSPANARKSLWASAIGLASIGIIWAMANPHYSIVTRMGVAGLAAFFAAAGLVWLLAQLPIASAAPVSHEASKAPPHVFGNDLTVTGSTLRPLPGAVGIRVNGGSGHKINKNDIQADTGIELNETANNTVESNKIRPASPPPKK